MSKPIRVQNGSFVIYEDLPSKHPDYTFSKGTYCSLDVIIINELGYINANKLCLSFGVKDNGEPVKPLGHWLKTDAAKSKIAYYSSSGKIFPDKPVIRLASIVGNDLKGTYMCKPLILLVACWLSDDFYDKIYSIIEHHAQKEAASQLKSLNSALKKEKKQRLKEREEAKLIITEKADKIDELKADLEKMELKNKKMRKLLKEQHDDIKDLVTGNRQLGGQLTDIQEDLEITNELLGETNQKLSVACDDRVIQPVTKGKHTTFILIRVEKHKLYKVIRCQKSSVNMSLSNKGFDHSDIAFQIDTTPNAMALWNKARESIPYLTSRSNGGVIHGVTEDRFIEDLKLIHDNRYVVTLPSREEILDKLTKAQLNEIIKRMNIVIKPRSLKAHMIRAILEEEARLADA